MSTPEEEPKEATTTGGDAKNEEVTRKSIALAGARPSRLSMEGYIYNAHTVLVSALDPTTEQVSVELMEKCKGLVVVTAVHAGAIVTLYYGTGVLLKKTEGGGWSPPSAVAVGGTSFGAVLGGKRDNSIIFIMTDEAMTDFVERPQSRIALDAAGTAGNHGGSVNVGMDQETVTYTTTSGMYVGASVRMATMEPPSAQNASFYGKEVKAKDILCTPGAVELPENSQVPDIYEKLDMLAKGETWMPNDESLSRSRHFLDLAQSTSAKFMETSGSGK
eukprot:CAMPEP_0113457046 /NCGR_PEP_ID=MMETSP0014_2-20120614/9202_1 /TAXON_ID=2857 /ORGANISM="Nitzschia sp." /LENGTH=274 /DNA_ID=CAMNT_0000348521 /DNA_START=70 /DNA_END=894 /DNA_ORIENTATION=- /assembly_acc=CAM_ASM_000159